MQKKQIKKYHLHSDLADKLTESYFFNKTYDNFGEVEPKTVDKNKVYKKQKYKTA